jgi:hypothetical protein
LYWLSFSKRHQNSSNAEIAPNVKWPPSKFFVHVDERGNLSPALTKQFLPARAALLADYWQKIVLRAAKAHQVE